MTRSDYLKLATAVEFGEVKALSIRQPYPHFIFHGAPARGNDAPLPRKEVENRSWPTRHRGWFLIHAGKDTSEDRSTIRRLNLPLGGIVGFARITDCVTGRDGDPWFFGPYGFVLADATPLDLVLEKGALGFFKCSHAANIAVAAQIRALGLAQPLSGPEGVLRHAQDERT